MRGKQEGKQVRTLEAVCGFSLIPMYRNKQVLTQFGDDTYIKECKFQGADVALVFLFSDFESFSGTGHILSRENFTYSWGPMCTLISSSPSSTDRQLFPCASLYGTYLMTLSLPVHCDAHHKRHAYKGGALEVTVQPPKRTTNCRRLRASNRLYLPYFCVSWLWHEYLHDP